MKTKYATRTPRPRCPRFRESFETKSGTSSTRGKKTKTRRRQQRPSELGSARGHIRKSPQRLQRKVRLALNSVATSDFSERKQALLPATSNESSARNCFKWFSWPLYCRQSWIYLRSGNAQK